MTELDSNQRSAKKWVIGLVPKQPLPLGLVEQCMYRSQSEWSKGKKEFKKIQKHKLPSYQNMEKLITVKSQELKFDIKSE